MNQTVLHPFLWNELLIRDFNRPALPLFEYPVGGRERYLDALNVIRMEAQHMEEAEGGGQGTIVDGKTRDSLSHERECGRLTLRTINRSTPRSSIRRGIWVSFAHAESERSKE